MTFTRFRAGVVLLLVPFLANCAAPYVAPKAGPTARLDLVSHIGGKPMFWHDDQRACPAEKLATFDDDTLQEIGALVQGQPLHAPQSHGVAIEADRPFVLTATFGSMNCHASYSFLPRAGEHYEADARGLCVVRIIHITRNAGDGSTTREFEPTAERIDTICKDR